MLKARCRPLEPQILGYRLRFKSPIQCLDCSVQFFVTRRFVRYSLNQRELVIAQWTELLSDSLRHKSLPRL
jgi:hypothetical protein